MKKNLRASTGFELLISAILVRCSTNAGGKTKYLSSVFVFKAQMHCIFQVIFT